jgi:putative peptide zinc metalloprotease protein
MPLTGTPEELLQRPKMAAVEVVDFSEDDDAVVFCPARERYLRVRGPQWAFLRSLDGRRTIAELEDDACGQLPANMVRPVLARFAQVGLLEGGGQEDRQRGNRRVRITRPGVIQFSLVNPNRLLDRCIRIIRILGGRVGRVVSALMVIVGLPSIAVHADLAALGFSQLTAGVWAITLAAASLFCVVLHELGHAAAVKYFGGRVRRMGLMLFYLAPAMFCDTSDSWCFPRKRQRAVVAAAGVWVNIVIAAIVGMALWLPLPASTGAWLWYYFALLNLGLCVVNLIPFVQLDGYWLLVALTDVPNLRARALSYLRATVLRVVGGVAQTQTPKRPVLTLMFGLGCMLFPPILVLIVLLDYQHALLRLGPPGAVAWLLLTGSVAAVPRKGFFRIVRSARDWPSAARIRAGVLGGAAALVVAAVLAVVKLPLTVQGTFETSDSGEIVAVLPAHAGAYVSAGDRIQLRRGTWLVDRTPVAEGVRGSDSEPGDRELRYRVVLDHGELSKVPPSFRGSLSVRTGELGLPAWFRIVYLQPALSVLIGT